MDGAISTRKYPAYTTRQLEAFVAEGNGTPEMVQGIADRKAGKSTIRSVPQLTPMTEREVYIPRLRNAIASLETDSLYKCIRYVASQRGLTLCGSARMFLEDSKLAVCRGNLFYWLENDAPMAWLDWLSSTENFCKAIWSNE